VQHSFLLEITCDANHLIPLSKNVKQLNGRRLSLSHAPGSL
jgi:hypothetical protein